MPAEGGVITGTSPTTPGDATRARPTLPRLHVLTPQGADEDVLAVVDAALAGGARCVQVRAKGRTDRQLLALAAEVVARCRVVDAACVVNDRVDVALAVGADGVHLGADDLPVEVARQLVGERLWVGGTARDPDRARALVAAGADYLGVGPVHATATKDGLPAPLGTARLAEVAAAVAVPVLAIAGITAARVPAVLAAGAHGVAVVGAVAGAADPRAATRELLATLPAEAPGGPA
jgi:thiamine-phosphate pyrophosphorylase